MTRAQQIINRMPMVSRIAGSICCGCPTQDAIASGYVGLVEAVDRFDLSAGCSLSTFAGQRVRGAILDELRRQRGRGDRGKAEHVRHTDIASPETDPTDAIIIHDALDKLTQRERDVIEAYYYEGDTIPIIADSLGLTKGRVSQIINGALKKMRVAIDA